MATITYKDPTVIRFQDSGTNGTRFFLEESPSESVTVDTQDNHKFVVKGDIDLAALGGSAARVRSAGERLYRALIKAPSVKSALEAVLGARLRGAGDLNVYPIYLRLDSKRAEQFPWEALWVDEEVNFLALYGHQVGASPKELVPLWPLARVRASVRAVREIRRDVSPYLKISAVISAAGIPGESEWTELYNAVVPLGERVRLQVLVGEDKLKEKVEGDCKGAGLDASVEYVGDRTREFLYSKIQTFAPNLLHFFCHGSAVDRPHLEIASRSDWYRKRPAGSIVFVARDLRLFAEMGSLWLITLNCCQSATAIGNLRSLASTLIEAGAPAVVAMREPVQATAANVFTEALFSQLARTLPEYLARAGDREPRELPQHVWARSLQWVRHRLCELAVPDRPPSLSAADVKEWTMPVLYLHKASMVLQPKPAADLDLPERDRGRLRSEIDSLRRALYMLLDDPSTPAWRIDVIVNRISECESRLYVKQPGDAG